MTSIAKPANLLSLSPRTKLLQEAPISLLKCAFEKQTDFKPAALELNVVS